MVIYKSYSESMSGQMCATKRIGKQPLFDLGVERQ